MNLPLITIKEITSESAVVVVTNRGHLSEIENSYPKDLGASLMVDSEMMMMTGDAEREKAFRRASEPGTT